MYALGTMYAEGREVLQDYSSAMEWFRQAAAQGHPQAQAWLGTMYAQSQGVPRDYGKAITLLKQAADQREPSAQAWLGWLYEYGLGVAKDLAEAKEWYRKAAAQGQADAQARLAKLSDQGGAPDLSEVVVTCPDGDRLLGHMEARQHVFKVCFNNDKEIKASTEDELSKPEVVQTSLVPEVIDEAYNLGVRVAGVKPVRVSLIGTVEGNIAP
jgi:TPR repeat protein